MSELERYLDDLESRIDDQVEQALLDEWKGFISGQSNDNPFSPARTKRAHATVQWPSVRINDAQHDDEKMALHQLSECSASLEAGSGSPLGVRCNYGTGIMPSLFGAELYEMPEEMNTLQTTRPLAGGKDAIRVLVDRGVPDLDAGLGADVFRMAEVFLDIKARYPRIGRHVHIYHPDVQGPMDICELLWGSELFLDLYDCPDLVHALLDLVTETYIAFMRRWFDLVPPVGDYCVHWNILMKGQIMLRDDSAMNLSPTMCDEFVKPHDQRLLDEFGGGAVHFCGRGDHYIQSFSSIRGLNCINMSQPDFNDMEIICRNTIDKGICLAPLSGWAVRQLLERGRDLRGRVFSADWR